MGRHAFSVQLSLRNSKAVRAYSFQEQGREPAITPPNTPLFYHTAVLIKIFYRLSTRFFH